MSKAKVRPNSRVGQAITELLTEGRLDGGIFDWLHIAGRVTDDGGEVLVTGDSRYDYWRRHGYVGICAHDIVDQWNLPKHDIIEVRAYLSALGYKYFDDDHFAIPRLPFARGLWSELTGWEVDFAESGRPEWVDHKSRPRYLPDGYSGWRPNPEY